MKTERKQTGVSHSGQLPSTFFTNEQRERNAEVLPIYLRVHGFADDTSHTLKSIVSRNIGGICPAYDVLAVMVKNPPCEDLNLLAKRDVEKNILSCFTAGLG